MNNRNDEIKKGYAGLAWVMGGFQPTEKPEAYTLPKFEHDLTREEILDLYESVLNARFNEVIKDL
jgi:hypothetical protein